LENIDLRNGRIKIIDSKGHKDRIVMMGKDLTLLCQKYHAQIRRLHPNTSLFFPNPRGGEYCENWVNATFRKGIECSGLKYSGVNPPRPYDLRHTFATHRLYQWMRDGKDINAYLPYLSAYMGHSNFSSTAYYIHFVPGIFESMSGFDFSRFEALLPEVDAL
jgi:integrase